MMDLMVDSAQTLLESWEERVDNNGGTVDIKIDHDIRAYSADVISRTCFGSSYVKGKNIFLNLRELQKAVSRPNVLAEMTGLRFFATKKNRQAWELHKQVHKLILEIVKESGEDRNLLRAILHSASSSQAGLGEAENFILDNCRSIYFAGYESTAVTAAWCLMLLGLHPEWQDRVPEEVMEICGGRPVDSQSLQKM